MSPQPRNTKIMRREGPWGRAGWFRSCYLTLTDATAGRLERSRATLLQNQPPPPRGQVGGGSGRPQPQAATPPGGSRKTSEGGSVGGGVGGYGGKGVGAGHCRQGRQQWGRQKVPWPSGVDMCARITPSVPLCLCSCEAECVWGREAKGDCESDNDNTCVHVSWGHTRMERMGSQLLFLKWEGQSLRGGHGSLSCPAQSNSCPGGCESGWGQGKRGDKESHRPQPPPSSVTCTQRGALVALPGLPTPTLWR